jgi:hypothetical protein
MTAKQRQARAKFKAVVKEASKLRKKNPKLTQAQAVKQAWAISYSKKSKGTKLGAVKKKSATRVKAKKGKSTEMHTDTKSHNVNIRVVSGIEPLRKRIEDGIILISRELKEINTKIKNEKNKFLKSSYLNKKRFLLNELKIGKQLLRKYK